MMGCSPVLSLLILILAVTLQARLITQASSQTKNLQVVSAVEGCQSLLTTCASMQCSDLEFICCI